MDMLGTAHPFRKNVAVLLRDHEGPVLEGGRARRFHIVRALGDRAEIHRLATPSGSDFATRSRAYLRSLVEGVLVALRTSAPRLLLFYPDLPGFVPARSWKVTVLLAWLCILRLVLTLRSKRLIVDVGDIPRWQYPALNLSLPVSPALLRLLEYWLFLLADQVTLSTSSLASRLSCDLGITPSRFVVLANGAPASLANLELPGAGPPLASQIGSERPPPIGGSRTFDPTGSVRRQESCSDRLHGRLKFVYVGSLDRRQDRGITGLCRAFIRSVEYDGAPIDLLLIGEGGDWIREEFRTSRLTVLGPLPEQELPVWIRKSHFAIIPYPIDRYYETVCPTKLAFYALCGIPILSTPLPEVVRLLERHLLGECVEPETVFTRWQELARKYEGFAGGIHLESLTWEAQVTSLVSS